ncbi:MAG: hypothetical protein KF774_03845 [Planctomyces sp.]|nr:hypothetical protein [Planctomyces sp.]
MSEPVDAVPSTACDALAWFIQQCIVKPRRPRWRRILIEAPGTLAGEMHKFERDVDAERCTALDRWPFETSRTPRELATRGAYSEGGTCETLSLQSALARLTPMQHDAVFVALDRSFATFFHHEGRVWRFPRQ